MKELICGSLKPVRSRQQFLFVLRCVVIGLILSVTASIAAWAIGHAVDLSWKVGAALILAGPVAGLLVGLAIRRGWHDAAAAVDGHYDLKDRTVTALAFAETAAPSELQALQMKEAMEHLKTVEPKSVVPLREPKPWQMLAAGLAALVTLTLFLTWPTRQQQAQAGPNATPDHIMAMAQERKAVVANFEKAISETMQDSDDDKSAENKGIKELLEKLNEKLDEFNETGVDEKEALAKLSEMMTEVQAMANQLNVAAMDGALSSLGTALAASTAFEGAGKALQDGKLEKAAKELEKIDDVKLTPKEAKALEEQLKQLAKKMGEAGQGSLSDAVSELAESLKSGNGKVGQAARNLAKKINNAVKRKKQNELLNALNEDFKESKCECQCNGGARIKQPQKSDSPSSSWGRAISGNTDGEKTKLASKRTEQQITGTPGSEGDSDVETTATPEARQKASREYKEKYEKFKKESETVVDGEPIPLGHRQMVKRYFESIRPSNSDMAEKPAAPEKK
jgi:hypothetical protein